MAKETLSNNNIVEVVEKNGITFSTKTINSGFTNEKKVFSFSGRVLKNKPTLIGELTLTAAENKRFKKNPGIKPSSNRNTNITSYLKTVLKSTTKDDNNNITSYTYNLIYTGKENVSVSNGLKYDLSNEVKKVRTKTTTGVTGVELGPLVVSQRGETRVITVTGKPNTTFKLAVLEWKDFKPSATAISQGYSKDEILNSTQTSILNFKRGKKEIINGAELYVMEESIGSSGKFSFTQKFPPKKSQTRYSVCISKTNTIGTWNGWKNNEHGWNDWYCKILNQYVNPKLTLRVTKTNVGYTINGNSSSVNTVDRVYNGVYNSRSILPEFQVTYDLAEVGGGKHFVIQSGASGDDLSGTKGDPVFSNTDSSASDWTNSVHATNGGTIVEIWNADAVVGSPTTTATLTFYAKIIQWGTDDVIMSLDLDDVIGLSA